MNRHTGFDIDLGTLGFAFTTPPLLIGGKAMEYYQLRKTGADIDFVVSRNDYQQLAEKYPDHLKEIFGDLGVCIYEFELWQSVFLFEFDFLAEKAVDLGVFKIISIEKLLFLKTLAITDEKNERDVKLLVDKIRDIQYGTDPIFDKAYFK